MSLALLRLGSASALALMVAFSPCAAADVDCSTAAAIAALRNGGEPDVRCTSTYDREIGRHAVIDSLTITGEQQDEIGEILDGMQRPSSERPDLSMSLPRQQPSFTTAPDGLGGFVLRDDAGAVYNPPTDGLGNSTFYTDDGRIMRCHTSDVGVTTCD